MRFDKIRVFCNHPGFVEPRAAHLRAALAFLPVERLSSAEVIVTSHSIPLGMARNCAYERQHWLIQDRMSADPTRRAGNMGRLNRARHSTNRTPPPH